MEFDFCLINFKDAFKPEFADNKFIIELIKDIQFTQLSSLNSATHDTTEKERNLSDIRQYLQNYDDFDKVVEILLTSKSPFFLGRVYGILKINILNKNAFFANKKMDALIRRNNSLKININNNFFLYLLLMNENKEIKIIFFNQYKKIIFITYFQNLNLI